ncbi:MAG TPA: hypothetical protein PKO25_09485 [Spirochaetota bacterium]|jgi:hypothetical protein|nr:hypothetical protein [Spirochaetota bacterium]HNU92092.1 hypothetical protein [Spirochaetota bacterium]HPV97720.1 hypothetical protein [Spirochaetota bacterium]
MNHDSYPEIKPGKKTLKRIYIAVMLFIVGRAIQAACRTDSTVKKEFQNFKDGFAFSLGVHPFGPWMIVGRDEKGRAKYLGWKPEGKKISLKMNIKNVEAAMLVFTFMESTSVAFARNRFVVDGDLIDALAIVRVLDLVEVYLLPKLIAGLAVKRYPKWSELSPVKKHLGRIVIYTRALLGF